MTVDLTPEEMELAKTFTALALKQYVDQHTVLSSKIQVGGSLLNKLASGSADLDPDEVRAAQEAVQVIEMLSARVPGLVQFDAAIGTQSLAAKLAAAAKNAAH